MEFYNEIVVTVLLLLLAVLTIGLIQYKILDKASKIILTYVFITFITELGAYICTYYYNYNVIIYNAYSIVQFSLLISYFFSSGNIKSNNKKRLIIIISGLFFYIINALLFQSLSNAVNSNFLAFESILITALSLNNLYKILDDESQTKAITTHFLFNSILLTFWSFTMFYWILGLTMYKVLSTASTWLSVMIVFINILTYTGFGLVFLFYKKLQPR